MALTVRETSSPATRTGESEGETTSYGNYCIEKQFAEATRGMDPQQATDYQTEVISEAVVRRVDPRTILNEHGFPC